MLKPQRLFVLTGAGCSTNSGIPDYRIGDGDGNERSRSASGLSGRRNWRAAATGRTAWSVGEGSARRGRGPPSIVAAGRKKIRKPNHFRAC